MLLGGTKNTLRRPRRLWIDLKQAALDNLLSVIDLQTQLEAFSSEN